MENKFSKVIAIKIATLALSLMICFLWGYWQGRNQQIAIYQSKIEFLPDINSCHP